jgi:predicted MFS family arabinose efflux permease
VATGSFYAPLISTTTRWFTQHRSLAVALVSAGLSVGSTVIAPLTRWMITTFDWRTAMFVLGDLVWLVAVPAALLVRNPPGAAVTAIPAATAGAGPALTIGQVVRTPQFAAIALTHFACCAAHSGPIFHMVTHAIDQGVGSMTAAGILGASGLASIGGRVVTGVVADRWGAKQTLVVALVFQALMVSTYLFVQTTGGLYALGVLFGLAYGAAMPLYALLTREYFGERVMGTVYGAVFVISCTGMGLGSWAGGAIHDTFGSYQGLFLVSFALGAAGIVTGLGLRPPVRVLARAA